MNTNELKSVQTEEVQREQDLARKTPSILPAASGPEGKREDERIQSVRETGDVIPINPSRSIHLNYRLHVY